MYKNYRLLVLKVKNLSRQYVRKHSASDVGILGISI